MKRAALALAALAALACGDDESAAPGRTLMTAPLVEKTGPNRAPVLSGVSLSQRSPVAGAPLEAKFEATDPDSDALQYEISWLRNGRVEQSGGSRAWTPSILEKGDRIEVRVRAGDGELWSEVASASARAGNSPPVVESLRIGPPQEVTAADEIVVTPVGADADGDELEYRYEWFVNGEPLRTAKSARFPAGKAKRGDRVSVRVTALDGDSESAPRDSGEITLANAAPVFEKFAGFEIEGGTFRHQFAASDPDGDRGLRFVLAEGPRGMDVDPTTGMATWKPEKGATGVLPVQVEVRDAYGAASAMRFELTLGSRGAAPAAEPAAQAEES
jgi:hypothetical protein